MSLFRRTFSAQGAPPGEIRLAATDQRPTAHRMIFDGASLAEDRFDSPDDTALVAHLAEGDRAGGPITWIDVKGIGDGTEIQALALKLGIHPLAVSDMVHLGQRPKVDVYEGGVLIVLRMVSVTDGTTDAVRSRPKMPGQIWEQVSVFLGPDWVLTVQETTEDCLGGLRERIRAGRPQIRTAGADYLGTMVVDAIVDGYFPLLEVYGDLLEDYEDLVLMEKEDHPLPKIYGVKRNLSLLRRAAWPLRDALYALMRRDDATLSEVSQLHMRDTLDHVMQVVDVTETFREVSSSLIDVHLSMTGQRTNEVMRVLTVISAIFIPLTFLAGVYGMNFDTSVPGNMPELEWHHGYLVFWFVSLILGSTLVALFARLGWLRFPAAAGGQRA